MDRGAWWAIVHAVTQSRIQLKQLSTAAWRCSVGLSFFHCVDVDLGPLSTTMQPHVAIEHSNDD